ncbi:MAG: carboxypeptidase-like regulatory domain-containing protein [Terracidiphilus sp.]
MRSPHGSRKLAALLVFGLLTGFPSIAQNAHLASSGSALYSITGTVVNAASGEPVRHANVAALSEEDSHTVAAVESDNEGHFSLDHLPAAKYQLTASKRGFRTAFYDEHQEFNSAIVTGPGQETTHLTFRLVPGAILHGVVTTDGGDPVENARVMLFQKTRDGRVGGRIAQSDNVNTDDTGAYEFNNLAAGEYLLAVVAEPWYALHRSSSRMRQRSTGAADSDGGTADPAEALDVAYPVTYFDSTTDEASASRIVLAGGSRVEANITLHATPALHIDVDTPRKQDGSIARAEMRQTVFGSVVATESAGYLDSAQTEGGTTEFIGVAPGRYELSQGDPPRILELDAASSMQVDPALGVPAVSILGTLRTLAGAPLTDECNVSLESTDNSARQNSMQAICMHGSFSFSSVPAGLWQLSAEGAGSQFSIASVTVGNQTRAGNLIAVQDLPLSLIVTITQGATRVTGFAKRAGKGVAGVMVVLVPRELTALPALARRDQSDSDGSFSLRDVAPGQYTLVAIEDGWELDWAQPEVIARYLRGGVAVTVADKPGKLQPLAEPVPVQTR